MPDRTPAAPLRRIVACRVLAMRAGLDGAALDAEVARLFGESLATLTDREADLLEKWLEARIRRLARERSDADALRNAPATRGDAPPRDGNGELAQRDVRPDRARQRGAGEVAA